METKTILSKFKEGLLWFFKKTWWVFASIFSYLIFNILVNSTKNKDIEKENKVTDLKEDIKTDIDTIAAKTEDIISNVENIETVLEEKEEELSNIEEISVKTQIEKATDLGFKKRGE